MSKKDMNIITSIMGSKDGETVEQMIMKSLQDTPLKRYKKFECIKGIADKENMNVICTKGDIVILESTDEGEVLVTSLYGFSEGYELSLTPTQFVDSFRFMEIKTI